MLLAAKRPHASMARKPPRPTQEESTDLCRMNPRAPDQHTKSAWTSSPNLGNRNQTLKHDKHLNTKHRKKGWCKKCKTPIWASCCANMPQHFHRLLRKYLRFFSPRLDAERIGHEGTKYKFLQILQVENPGEKHRRTDRWV